MEQTLTVHSARLVQGGVEVTLVDGSSPPTGPRAAGGVGVTIVLTAAQAANYAIGRQVKLTLAPQ